METSMSGHIRVILIDDHIYIHEAVSAVLELVDDIELVAQGSNGLEAVQLCEQFAPDLVLMDIVMPRMNGIEATKQILSKHPQIRILALSSFQDRDSVRAMLESGAIGYVLKDGSSNDLEDSIRTAYKGKSVLSPEITDILLRPPSSSTNGYGLTVREMEILRLMAKGMNNHEIAAALTVSYSTVRFHITHITSKMGVKSRAEATALAVREGII
jgi:two-component system, NarL family, response regulator LiaR